MRTARLLTVFRSARGEGGVRPEGVFAWGCLPMGVSAWGVSAQEGGVCLGGICPGLMDIPAFIWANNPPPPRWTEFLTHARENITFPQLLLGAVTITVIRNALLGTFREIVRVRHDDFHFRRRQAATKH